MKPSAFLLPGVIFITPVVLKSQSVVPQHSISLCASRDCPIGYHTDHNDGTINDGHGIHNTAYVIPAIGGNGVNLNRSLIDFDLNAVPANATITGAFLSLYSLHPIGSYPGHTGAFNDCWLQRITQQWSEYTATWVNAPATTTVNQVSLAAATSYSQDYLNINVTTLVQDMKNNPGAGFGFMLRLQTEALTNILAFCSKDHPISDFCPSLKIFYLGSDTIVPLSIIQNENQPGFLVWQNEAKEELFVEANFDLADGDWITISLTDGRQLLNMKLESARRNEYPLTKLPGGIYVLQYFHEDQAILRKKLVLR
jgi:hypothetical protein